MKLDQRKRFKRIRTWLSPFLYSKLQSRRTIRGFSIRRRIFGCVTSLFNITPRRTQESSIVPPGIYSPTHKSVVLLLFKRIKCRQQYLFNFSISLDINLTPPILVDSDARNGIQRDLASQFRPAVDKLGPQARFNDGQNL